MGLSTWAVRQKILRAKSPEERSRIAKELGRRGGTVTAIRAQRKRESTTAAPVRDWWSGWNEEE